MEKEDREKGIDKEFWFNEREDYIPSYRVMADLDSQKGLGKEEFRYYTGSISFSEEELAFLNNDYKNSNSLAKLLSMSTQRTLIKDYQLQMYGSI